MRTAPPSRQTGTSEPISAPMPRRSSSDSGRFQARRARRRNAAASVEPPPSPLVTGMRLTTSTLPALGTEQCCWRVDQARAMMSSDVSMDTGRPAGSRYSIERWLSAGVRRMSSTRSSETATEARLWNPSSRLPITSSVRLSLAAPTVVQVVMRTGRIVR